MTKHILGASSVGWLFLFLLTTVVLAGCGPEIPAEAMEPQPTAKVAFLPPVSVASTFQSPLPTPTPVYRAEDLIVVSETPLTQNGGVMGGVTVSPRGDRIAFLKESDQFLELSPNMKRMVTPLWVMDRNGSNAVQIADNAQWPAWEPNGQRIAYVQGIQPERATAYLANVQTKQNRALREVPWQRLFWSGSDQVAFVDNQRVQIWNNGQAQPLSGLDLPDDVNLIQIYPSPDRRKLFFQRKQELWLANLQTSQMRKVANGFLGYVNGVAWSPTGDKAAFPLHHDGLWVMDLITCQKQKISDLTVTGVVWSPKGNVLAFTGQEVAGPGTAMFTEIYLINVDGTGIQQLTHNRLPDYMYGWMPDSLDMLIGRGDESGQSTDLWLLSLAIQQSDKVKE